MFIYLFSGRQSLEHENCVNSFLDRIPQKVEGVSERKRVEKERKHLYERRDAGINVYT